METPRDALLSSLRRSWDTLVRRISDAMLEGPAYRSLDSNELLRASDRIARAFAVAIAGKPIPKDTLRALQLVGAQLARDGLELQSVAEGVVAAVGAGVSHISELATELSLNGLDQAVEVVHLVVVPMCQAHSVVLGALAEGFADGRSYPIDPDASAAVGFTERVLFGGDEDWDLIRSASAALGHPVDERKWGVVLVADPGAGSLADLRPAALRLTALDGVIEGPPNHNPVSHIVLLLAASADEWPSLTERVYAAVESCAVAVVASTAPGDLNCCGDEYDRLSRNIQFARLLPTGRTPVDLALLQLCRTLAECSDVERAELFRLCLGPLVKDPRGADYLALLETLVACGVQQEAGSLLLYDESTVYRNLAQIEKLTGKAWRDHWDRLAICMAVICRWIAADEDDYDAATFGTAPIVARLRRRRR